MPPGFGVGVQLIPLDGQHRLEVQHRGKGGRRRGDPAALFQVFHGVHRDVDAGIVGTLLQPGFDLPGVPAFPGQLPGTDHRRRLGQGDAVVIHHLDPAFVLLCQLDGRAAGIAQPLDMGM